MKFGRFELDKRPGPDTVHLPARLLGVEGFSKPVQLLVLSATAPREAMERFLQGAQRLAELSDGNLVQVLEVGVEDGRPFLATEAPQGVTLSRLRASCLAKGLEGLPPVVAFGVGAELAKALAHAHAHADPDGQTDPVTHGAVAAEQVTVGDDGTVKLGGFVPWRAAQRPEEDVEGLVALVGGLVGEKDRKLVHEASAGALQAGDLRKAWAAYLTLRWPKVTPDARRTLLAFARGEVGRPALDAALGVTPRAAVRVPLWAVAVAVAGGGLATAALLWPSSPRAPAPKVAAPPPRVPAPGEARFSKEVPLSQAPRLALPNGLPTFESVDGLTLGELAPAAAAPQLLVQVEDPDGSTRLAVVPRVFWPLPNAAKVRVFAWEPFDARYRGLRQLWVSGDRAELSEERVEVEAQALHVEVPAERQLVLEVERKAGRGQVVVALSYGMDAPVRDGTRGEVTPWRFQPTRLVLGSGDVSPAFHGVQELAFATTGDAQFVVHVHEGEGSAFALQWPGWRATKPASEGRPEPAPPKVSGAVEGAADIGVWRALQQALALAPVMPDAPDGLGPRSTAWAAKDQLVACTLKYPDAYECWHFLALLATEPKEVARAAQGFLASAPENHPYRPQAEALAK